MNNWLNQLERKYGRFGIPNLTNILVGGQILVLAIELFVNQTVSVWLALSRYFLLRGQIWRIITFAFIPSYGGSAARDLSCFAPDDHVVRVTFNGSSTAKPLVASLAAEKGILVSVLSADTRDLSGQCYGSMLLKLPAELAVAQQAVEYMRSQSGVTVEEVTGI